MTLDELRKEFPTGTLSWQMGLWQEGRVNFQTYRVLYVFIRNDKGEQVANAVSFIQPDGKLGIVALQIVVDQEDSLPLQEIAQREKIRIEGLTCGLPAEFCQNIPRNLREKREQESKRPISGLGGNW